MCVYGGVVRIWGMGEGLYASQGLVIGLVKNRLIA